MTNTITALAPGGTKAITIILQDVKDSGPSAEFTIAIISVMLAIAAIAISIWQMRHQQKHDKISVQPRLQIIVHAVEGKPYKAVLSNCGLGPAEITKFSILINGKEIINPSGNQIRAQLCDLDIPEGKWEFYYCTPPEFFPVGREFNLLEYLGEHQTKFAKEMSKVEWSIEYKSVYNELQILRESGLPEDFLHTS